MEWALETRGLTKRWGAFAANEAIDLRIAQGSRHALIGPNGAGKTTLVNLLSGTLKPTSGEVRLNGVPVTGLSQVRRVRRGLTRTYQINTLFSGLSVFESVLLARLEQSGRAGRWDLGLSRCDRETEETWKLLERLGLVEEAGIETRQLAYGKQRLLELALALATEPKVLLLDEPAAGIPTHENGPILAVLDALPRDVTVVLIEHDMDLVFRFAERISVLVAGRVLVEGSPQEIASHAGVQELYLGGPEL
jgi:branched-chain amino acid transport system ATP-binding protein